LGSESFLCTVGPMPAIADGITCSRDAASSLPRATRGRESLLPLALDAASYTDRPGHFSAMALRSTGSLTYCSMYPHETHTCRSGVTFHQNETLKTFMMTSRVVPVGPIRMSVDRHFGQRPDFIADLPAGRSVSETRHSCLPNVLWDSGANCWELTAVAPGSNQPERHAAAILPTQVPGCQAPSTHRWLPVLTPEARVRQSPLRWRARRLSPSPQ